MQRGGWHAGAATLALLALAGCASVAEPTPVATYDGRYIGTRDANRPDACGVAPVHGPVSAVVRRGRLRMQLFGPGTVLEGSVGEDGRLRASGMWSAGRDFPTMTVLRGVIEHGRLTGEATDWRCVTRVALRRNGPRRAALP